MQCSDSTAATQRDKMSECVLHLFTKSQIIPKDWCKRSRDLLRQSSPFTFCQDVTAQGRILFSYSPAAFPKAHGLCPVADGIIALYESNEHCSAHAQAVWPKGCVQSICHVVAWYCHVLWNQSAGFWLLQKLKECRIEQTVCKTLIMGFNDAVGSKVAECFLFTWPNSAVLQLHWN